MVFACFRFYNIKLVLILLFDLRDLIVVIKLFCIFNYFRQN